MTAANRVAQHGAVTLDIDVPDTPPRRTPPPSLLAVTLLLVLSAGWTLTETPYTSPAHVTSVACAVLAAALAPAMLLGYGWARTGVLVTLGLYVTGATVNVLLVPELPLGLLALRAILWSTVAVVLLFRPRCTEFLARCRADRVIARLPRADRRVSRSSRLPSPLS